MVIRFIFFIICFVTMLVGCEEDRSTRLQDSIDTKISVALFDPANSIIPFPNNLLFNGTTDGTLNIPTSDPEDTSDPKVAMNSLDGFSTNAPISTTFSTPIDTLTIPGNVRLFTASINDYHLNPGGEPNFVVLGITSELTQDVDFIVSVSNETTLVIKPIKPLMTKSGYVAVVTNGLKDMDGDVFRPDLTYAITKETNSLIVDGVSRLPALDSLTSEALQNLEGLRLLTNITEAAAVVFDNANGGVLNRSDIVLSWSFSTQSAGDILSAERDEIPVPVVSAFTKMLDAEKTAFTSNLSNVDVYKGTIDVPYYIDAPSNVDKLKPLSSFWKNSDGVGLSPLPVGSGNNPVPTTTLSIPVLISVPSTATYNSTGIPVVIYQHGITSNRTSGLALADMLASRGYAMIAIDLPLHGVTDSTNYFYDEFNERTFNLDFADNTTPTLGPDGIPDSSGKYFINLASLQTSRDNVRQGIMDLFSLVKAVAQFDVNTAGLDFDAADISFVGHSLGGIVGIPFLALEANVKTSVIAMAGGGIAKILDGSASIGPEIVKSLAAKGVVKGTAEYEAFMLAAQTVLDSVDPINYASMVGASRGILLLEIVGDDNTGSPSDLVIPNMVPDKNDTSGTVTAPLAGTDPLIGIMGLTPVTTQDLAGVNVNAVVRFNSGHHGSLLTNQGITNIPTILNSSDVFVEIQTILTEFIASGGATVDISNTSVIAP